MRFEATIIGLGYIGLPTAVLIASHKKNVLGVDIDEKVIKKLSSGQSHIVEPGLNDALKKVTNNKSLEFSNKPEKSKVFVIAVPTPFKNNADNIPEPDLVFVDNAMKSIAPYIENGDLIIIESTIPVGATERFAKKLMQIRNDLNLDFKSSNEIDINIAHCPERVLPGNIMKEIINNDRIVGGLTKKCSKAASAFYQKFVNGKIHETSSKIAELTKLSENSFRDVQIAFANELSIICDSAGIDVKELIMLANKHPRVNILQPGPGVGGHCIAVDPWFIASSFPDKSKLIQTARDINNKKPSWVIGKIEKNLNEQYLKNANRKLNVGFFGLSYKPNIDDFRESPAIEIAKHFSGNKNFNFKTVEPNSNKKEFIKDMENITIEDSCKSIDIAIFLVKHDEFFKIDKKDYLLALDFTG